MNVLQPRHITRDRQPQFGILVRLKGRHFLIVLVVLTVVFYAGILVGK